MSGPPKLERSLWTDADLEVMGWHDATIHGLAFSPETDELILDLDYLLKWVKPGQAETGFSFWVAAATLVFREVSDLRFGVATEGELSLDELRREVKESGPDRYTLSCHEGELSLTAAGLEQHLRQRPIFSAEQTLTPEQRGGRSFDRPGEWIDPWALAGATQLGQPVRGFATGDEDQWLRMRLALWPDHDAAGHRAEMTTWIATPGTTVFFALGEHERPVGFAELSERTHVDGCESSPVAYLEGWWVDEPARRQGVGAALIRAAESWARARGHRELASDTELSNESAQQAQVALGFEEVDRVALYRKVL